MLVGILIKNGNVIDWNKGLVIEDENYNQFVWVPCTTDINNTLVPLFSRYILDEKNIFSPRNDDILKELHIESQKFIENDPINKEILTSINKYCGFYIGRYETGLNTGNMRKSGTNPNNPFLDDDIPVIKKGQKVWNYLTKTKAKKLADGFLDNDTVKSTLITSLCWDTTIKWISNSINDFITNPEKYGYYEYTLSKYKITGPSPFMTFRTGEKETYCQKNIYDISGNVAEMTTEICKNYDNTVTSVARGNSPDKSIVIRNNITNDRIDPMLGFRIILYLK